MSYKAFQDYYIEESIKHLLVYEYQGVLISPPFATEKCKDYSKVWCIDGKDNFYIDLDVPNATSKFNASVVIGDSIWFIPYGIWDNFNVVVQIKDFKPIYHTLDSPGKGQFYSVATSGTTAFSFPLGYEETNNGLYIKDNKVTLVPFNRKEHFKLHMGTVFCNGRYWSAPRSDEPGYINLMSFDGENYQEFPINVKNKQVTRKYTDIIVYGNKLIALPFGETPGMTEVLEFDTTNNTYQLIELNVRDFAKKFNVGVLVDDTIIAVPYGDDNYNDSNLGLVYNVRTHEHYTFDIGINYGGKYRFRSGIKHNENIVFIPSGTPSCPILVIDKKGNILHKEYYTDYILGRPIIHKDKVCTIAYDRRTGDHQLISFDF